jgi:molybdenum cofactor guanylyltransferase
VNLPLIAYVTAIPPDAGAGWPVARMIERAGLVRIPCPPDAKARLRGANTPAERDDLLAALAETEAAQKGGAA